MRTVGQVDKYGTEVKFEYYLGGNDDANVFCRAFSREDITFFGLFIIHSYWCRIRKTGLGFGTWSIEKFLNLSASQLEADIEERMVNWNVYVISITSLPMT